MSDINTILTQIRSRLSDDSEVDKITPRLSSVQERADGAPQGFPCVLLHVASEKFEKDSVQGYVTPVMFEVYVGGADVTVIPAQLRTLVHSIRKSITRSQNLNGTCQDCLWHGDIRYVYGKTARGYVGKATLTLLVLYKQEWI